MPSVSLDRCFTTGTQLHNTTPLSILVRKFVVGPEAAVPDPKKPWERNLTLDQMRSELAPRILIEDVLNSSLSMVLLDIRSGEDFNQGHIPGSIHLNLKETSFRDLNIHSGKHIVVIGNRGNDASKLANALVKAKFPFVSVLHGGIESAGGSALHHK